MNRDLLLMMAGVLILLVAASIALDHGSQGAKRGTEEGGCEFQCADKILVGHGCGFRAYPLARPLDYGCAFRFDLVSSIERIHHSTELGTRPSQ